MGGAGGTAPAMAAPQAVSQFGGESPLHLSAAALTFVLALIFAILGFLKLLRSPRRLFVRMGPFWRGFTQISPLLDVSLEAVDFSTQYGRGRALESRTSSPADRQANEEAGKRVRESLFAIASSRCVPA